MTLLPASFNILFLNTVTDSSPVSFLGKQNRVLAAAEPTTVQLKGGLGFSLILKDDGSVWAFGRGDYGSLGQNDFLDRSAPTRISPTYFNNEKVVQIEASSTAAIARTETNKVYYWGYGQSTPRLVYNSLPILDIEVAGKNDSNQNVSFHIVTNDGLFRSTGNNISGTFGIGTSGSHAALGDCSYLNDTPTYSNFSNVALKSAIIESCPSNSDFKRVKDGTGVPLDNILDTSISTNSNKVLAYTSTGDLYTWGYSTGNLPIKLPKAKEYSIKKIEMSVYPTFLTTDGKLFYYPNNTSDPVEISLENSSSPIKNIESGDKNLLVLDSSNKLYGIGPNTYGSLGSLISSNGIDFSAKKALYTGIDNVQRMGAGVNQTIIQYINSSFATLGKNGYGELATTDSNLKSTFVRNPYISNVKYISAQNYTTFAATTDNKFYGWGGRDPKEVLYRDGPINAPNVIRDFSSVSNIVGLSGYSGYYIHQGILLENGQFWTFGENWKKGVGTTASYYTLAPLVNRNSSTTQTNFQLIDASQGSFHGTAISSDNKVFTWGFDTYGLLGLGYRLNEVVAGVSESGSAYAFQEPIVPNGEKFVKVYSGEYEDFLLTDTGKVYAWGAGTSYKNRFGIRLDPDRPTLINSLPPIKEVAFGSHHNLFLDFSGNVWAAGDNSYGQLGLGNTSTPSIPTKIPSLSNIKTIGTGRSSSYAVTQSGELYSFGDNRSGQLGLGDLIQRNEPRLVPGVSDVKEVRAGRKHAVFITNSGDLYVAGSDSDGQLGLAQSQINSTPIPVVFPPSVTISSSDNQVLSIKDTLSITGNVFTDTEGVSMDLSYTIESKDGKTTKSLKQYVTSSSAETFSISLPLSNYELGSYTVIVKVVTSTGVTSQSAINFSIQDKINPTVSISKSTSPKWSLSPISVDVSADDTGGSGYRGYRYAITSSTSKPTTWSPIDLNKDGSILINKSGEEYLHIEAYDNIGNVTYLRGGPYYVDLDPPVFSFTEPSKWQQDHLNLTINVSDASNILSEKWLEGEVTIGKIKSSGKALTTISLPITENRYYSFYAIDENNQETLQTYKVSNINYKPVLHSSPSQFLIPYKTKNSYSLPVTYSHNDNGDLTHLVITAQDKVITSSNADTNSRVNEVMNWSSDFSSLNENTLYEAEVFLSDSRGGSSTKQPIQIEIYNPSLAASSKLSGIELRWQKSKIGLEYRLLRNGEVIYTGATNSYTDTDVEKDSANIYELEVFVNGKYILVDSLDKQSGYNIFETPSKIIFPTVTLGSTLPIRANSMDLDYVKYKDYADIKTPYSIRVSISDFSSEHSSFTASSFIVKNIKKLNNLNEVEKVYPDISLTSTPYELITTNDTETNSYTKLEITKDNIEMIIPSSLQLKSGDSELFNSTVIWDATIAP